MSHSADRASGSSPATSGNLRLVRCRTYGTEGDSCYARPTLTLVEPVDPVPAEILAAMVDLVREPARRRGDSVAAGIFATADGRVAIEYRAGEYVRISFLGDGPIRSRSLPPDWPRARVKA